MVLCIFDKCNEQIRAIEPLCQGKMKAKHENDKVAIKKGLNFIDIKRNNAQ